MKERLTSKISILAATALTLGTCLPTGIAFADPDPETPPVPPSVGNQSGAGSTALTMVWENANAEYGGTEYQSGDYANPDGPDDDTWGDNLAFSAPSAINFVAQANGNLLAPQSNIDIVNHSTYGIRVSSMKLDANTADGWNIVANAEAAANTPNAVWGEIGVANDMLNWASYTAAKANVTKAYEWNMNATGNAGDSLALTTSGNFANLSIDLSTAQTFGTIHWYLKAGNADGPVSITNGTVSNGTFVVGTSNEATENELLFAGDTAHVVTTPATGYKLASVTVVENGTSNVIPATVEGNNATFTMPAGSVTVTPVFEKINYNMLNNTVSNGTFFMAKNVNAVSADATAQYGDDVYIISDPAIGYELSDATVTGDVSGNDIATTLIGDDKAQFSMPAESVSAEVEFDKIDYSILTPAVSNGTYIVDLSATPSSNISQAQYGDTVYVGVSPALGYEASVVVRGAVSGTDTPVPLTNNIGSFSMSDENITVLVTFSKANYTISTLAATNGSFVVSKNASGSPVASSANYNDIVHVVATPDSGYKLSGVTVTGASSSPSVMISGNTASFTMPAEAVNVSVSFDGLLPSVNNLTTTSSYTYIDNNESKGRPKVVTVGSDGDLSLAELKEVAADIATKGYDSTGSNPSKSKYSTTVASYMENDVSFVFADDPNTVPMEYRIIGVNHSPANGETGLTFMAKKALDQGFWMNDAGSNKNGWVMSLLRTELNPASVDTSTTASTDHIYQLLPPSLRASEADGGVKTVVKHSNDGLRTTASPGNLHSSPGGNACDNTSRDRFWIPSDQEVYGNDCQHDVNNNVNSQYEYFALKGVTFSTYTLLATMNKTITDAYCNKKTPSNAYSYYQYYWWLRSTYDYSNNFTAVSDNGRPSGQTAHYSQPVLPCFCLGDTSIDGSSISGTTMKTSRTMNISDTGTASGVYGNRIDVKDVITIPGASKLHVKIQYSTEANTDYVYVFKGVYSGYASNITSQSGQLKTYSGGANASSYSYTDEFDVTGDTVTFAFHSNYQNTYYGYYAVVTKVS